MQAYETLPRRDLVIGNERWTGWALGEDDVWVLEARGHTPDEMLFHLPEHQLLHTADLTFPLFPTFPSSDGVRTRAVLERCRAMAADGAVRLLTDAHHHTVYHGQDDVVAFLQTLLFEHDHFQAVLREILDGHDGLTVAEIHTELRRRRGDPVGAPLPVVGVSLSADVPSADHRRVAAGNGLHNHRPSWPAPLPPADSVLRSPAGSPSQA